MANYQPPSPELTFAVKNKDTEELWIGAEEDKGNCQFVQNMVGPVSGQDKERSSPVLVVDLIPEFQKSDLRVPATLPGKECDRENGPA